MVGQGDVGGEDEGCSSSDEDSEKNEGEKKDGELDGSALATGLGVRGRVTFEDPWSESSWEIGCAKVTLRRLELVLDEDAAESREASDVPEGIASGTEGRGGAQE